MLITSIRKKVNRISRTKMKEENVHMPGISGESNNDRKEVIGKACVALIHCSFEKDKGLKGGDLSLIST